MKNRTFYATFLLFILAIYSGILVLSIITLHGTIRQVKERCLNEQYFIASAIYNDISSLENRGIDISSEMENLMRPYLYLAGNRKTILSVYKNDELIHTTGIKLDLKPFLNPNLGKDRTISINQNDKRYFCSVSGNLPKPFESYMIFYQIDVTEQIKSWKTRNSTMIITGGIVSLMLSFFLMILLNKLFRPLSQITNLSQKIADGNYMVRLPDKGNDEIAQMARSFNYMACEIENKIRELSTAAANRQQFVDNFAHELRTPLTAIYGYAEYMQRASLSKDDTIFALNSILSETRHMQLMANQLMELSNLRNGEIQMENQDLSQILDLAKSTLAQKLIAKNIKLQISSNVKNLTGDAILLQSLFVNLIDNAVKASDKGAVVNVSTFYKDGKPVIEISDYGKGIEQSELKRIMEPYYRVDKSRNHKDGGVGLGLAICHQITSRHKAELSFYSIPGKGTKAMIIFTIP